MCRSPHGDHDDYAVPGTPRLERQDLTLKLLAHKLRLKNASRDVIFARTLC